MLNMEYFLSRESFDILLAHVENGFPLGNTKTAKSENLTRRDIALKYENLPI